MLLIARVFVTSLSLLFPSILCGHARSLTHSRSSDESVTLSRKPINSLKSFLLAGARAPVARLVFANRLDAANPRNGILSSGRQRRLQRRRLAHQTQMTDGVPPNAELQSSSKNAMSLGTSTAVGDDWVSGIRVTDKNAQLAVAPTVASSTDKNALITQTVLVDKQDATESSAKTLLRATMEENAILRDRLDELERSIGETQDPCEVLDDGGGWTSSLGRRSAWLLGLLVCQSFSSSILAANEPLLTSHPTVIFFLTMLVGAGGNAGNQAAVRVIRGLATGEISPDASERTKTIVSNEMVRAVALASIVVVAGFARVLLFEGTLNDAVAISTSLFFVVSISVILGTLLPLFLQALKVDAANASTSIQVIMDVLGVLITCTVAPEVFELLERAPLPALSI